jgi:hypothetical protein
MGQRSGHGQQFKARFLRTSPPTSADGIEKYLSSGMIRGVGPAYAKKLVRAFGEKVFDVIIGGLFGGCACWSPSAFVIHG